MYNLLPLRHYQLVAHRHLRAGQCCRSMDKHTDHYCSSVLPFFQKFVFVESFNLNWQMQNQINLNSVIVNPHQMQLYSTAIPVATRDLKYKRQIVYDLDANPPIRPDLYHGNFQPSDITVSNAVILSISREGPLRYSNAQRQGYNLQSYGDSFHQWPQNSGDPYLISYVGSQHRFNCHKYDELNQPHPQPKMILLFARENSKLPFTYFGLVSVVQFHGNTPQRQNRPMWTLALSDRHPPQHAIDKLRLIFD